MTEVSTRTAVLLDRYPLWLEAVEAVLLRLDVRTIGKATSPTEALELIARWRPQIFITDIETNDGEIDGIACIQQARLSVPDLRAVVLSTLADTSQIDTALAAGAVAYVMKSAHPDDFASAVRQTFSLSVYFAGARTVAGPAPAEQVPANSAALTRREHEVLRLVAEGHSNAKLAKMLWITEQTVKFHLSNVYRKLDVSNRTEAARWAQRNGFLGEHENARA